MSQINPLSPLLKAMECFEITASMLRTLDHIVQKTYQDERQINWMEIYAGEKATRIYVKTPGFQKNPRRH